MAWQRVTVIRTEGGKPRDLCFDDAPNPDGSEGRGMSMIAALKNRVRREELFSVTVTPVMQEPPPEEPVRPRKATKAAEAPAAE